MAFTQPIQNNALPPEILSPIFVSIVDASLYARSVGDDSYGSTEYPTLISSVCAYWRRISISIPHLWSHIDFMSSNHYMRNIEHVKLWLERSQILPLRLRVGKGGEKAEREEITIVSALNSPRHIDEQVISALLASAPRLHSFTLKFGYPSFAAQVLLALLPKEGQHPIRELAIRQGRWLMTSCSQILPQTEWNQLLEPLHVLHLERTDIALNSIPCRNLVELQLVYPSNFAVSDFAQVLGSNPSLRTIVLDGFVGGYIDFPPTVTSISLPSLRHVRLSTNQEFVTSLFKLLTSGPHGLDLHLGHIEDLTSLMDTMIPFFTRTNIKSLHLQAQKVSLLPILKALPYLQSLELSTFDFDASTFAGLESAADLTPKLHTIDLNECSFDDYLEVYSGLRALLSLPSVRRIRHLNCVHWDKHKTGERFVSLLEKGGFAPAIIQASALDFEQRASPFQ
ncbi:hypothetical protein BDV93DRAFT_546413 [Ceratobasidium sp. AG-I]|nr:hypothetical protein BDV93DRAFT_546413 [Ceratobasidium sp. AG-I]